MFPERETYHCVEDIPILTDLLTVVQQIQPQLDLTCPSHRCDTHPVPPSFCQKQPWPQHWGQTQLSISVCKVFGTQCYPSYIINLPCASTETSVLKEKKNWSYLMGKQTRTAQKLAGFQEPNTCISLLSSVLFSVLTLLFQYYSTMFVFCKSIAPASMG